MDVTDLHFELHVRDLEVAKHFYVEQLGLPILQQVPSMNLIAVRVGRSRMSIFGNRTDQNGSGPSQIIVSVRDVEASSAELLAKGVVISGPPVEAGKFLRFFTICDPDGNTVAISEYLRDPIAPI